MSLNFLLSNEATYRIGLRTRIKQDCEGESIFEKYIQMKDLNTFTMASSELRQRISFQILAEYNVIANLS